MEDHSVFMDKALVPGDPELRDQLGESYFLWKKVESLVFKMYPNGLPEWNFPGKKYGWSFRIKDKKRAILYLLPRKDYFKVAFVFGGKAFNEILASEVDDSIKTDLKEARVYAEGRGVAIKVLNENHLKDIEKLIEIKLNH